MRFGAKNSGILKIRLQVLWRSLSINIEVIEFKNSPHGHIKVKPVKTICNVYVLKNSRSVIKIQNRTLFIPRWCSYLSNKSLNEVAIYGEKFNLCSFLTMCRGINGHEHIIKHSGQHNIVLLCTNNGVNQISPHLSYASTFTLLNWLSWEHLKIRSYIGTITWY